MVGIQRGVGVVLCTIYLFIVAYVTTRKCQINYHCICHYKKATTVENKKEQKEIVKAEHEDCNEEELNDNKLINDTRPTKIKVYFPKPIRVSRTNSFDSGTSHSDAAEKVVSAIPVAALFEEEEEDDFLGGGKHVYSDANMLE